MKQYLFFATAPKAMEQLLADELRALGAEQIKPRVAGAAFSASLQTAYRICLWSRIANRVLLTLSSFPVNSQDDLYHGVQKINWFEHLVPTGSFAVTLDAKRSKAIRNTHFGALKVKDAIVDQMRAKFNKRPDIDIERPDIRITVFIDGDNAQLSLDLSGDSLHKRGYRSTQIAAPIKENLASALLLRSGWPQIGKHGGSLLDPMCGSGTLLLEGALIAADYAPGLLRDYFGFLGWKKHDTAVWQALRTEAEEHKQRGLQNLPVIIGFDRDRRAINAAQEHCERAGLRGKIHFERRDIGDAKPADSWQAGLVVCNPPYGERLGDEDQASLLYKQFGEILKEHFNGWQAGIIISNPELGFRLGIRSQKPVTFYNGALECKLLRMKVEPEAFFEPKAKTEAERIEQIVKHSETLEMTPGAEMFANRLQKNLKKFAKWAKQQHIDCYRAYDADLPEYALAVDLYQGDKLWVQVQEYEAPKSVDPQKAAQRLTEALAVLPKVLGIPREQLFLKVRRKQKNIAQYEKQADLGKFYSVAEGGCRFWINFSDYLDTGLFLDHRPLRLILQREAKGKRFLNLFAYTGSATVHAAFGGASATTTVDMSNTYLDWAKRNMALNHLQGTHEFIQADCLEWLEREAKQRRRQYDLIFLDPPTFSNSKRMEQIFDIQKDHVRLITDAVRLLAPGGVLYFSTNFRRFKIDAEALASLKLENISAQTIDADFARDPKIHYCWRIQA
ncbi:MAG: bifunctional 23S rRNA (guanine(2069)-N(7))-methyltransferase RlmK/23S rRNA (guanine(2445)-N(2))-methyltransferase RlmL [Gammaproteobacteria bacterium]